MSGGGIDKAPGNILAEEHDVRLEDAVASLASRHRKRGKIDGIEVGIAVRRIGGIQIEPTWVQSRQLVLKLIPRCLPSAPHAANKIQPAMQVDYTLVAGSLMQPIDVLGEHEFGSAHRLKPREGPMRRVRARPAEPLPSDQAARPIALARRLLGHESLVGHRRLTFPLAIDIPIIGNARIRAAACTGQNEKALMTVDEIP
jgi:hypothetical protein